MLSPNGHLLDDIDMLVTIAGTRGLHLQQPGGTLGPAEAQYLQRQLPRPTQTIQRLRALAESLGLLDSRSGRLTASFGSARWARTPLQVRARLVYTHWCLHLGEVALARPQSAWVLSACRGDVLRVLHAVPTATGIDLVDLAEQVGDQLRVTADPAFVDHLVALFLDPLCSLGVASLEPGDPHPPQRVRLSPDATRVIAWPTCSFTGYPPAP